MKETEFRDVRNDDDKLREEFNKLFWSDIRQDCYSYKCELRDCCECDSYNTYFEEYKNEREREKKI